MGISSVKELFSGKVKYGAVFHHYNKWSKKGEWKSLWLQLLDKHRSELDMSSVDLDGSHTPAIRGGGRSRLSGKEKTQDDQCPLSYRQERASSRHVRSEKRGTS